MFILKVVLCGITIVLLIIGINAANKNDSKIVTIVSLVMSTISTILTILAFTIPAPSVSYWIKSITGLGPSITHEGIVKEYTSYTDFQSHDRNDVLYMGYDGTPSTITIHTKGKYSNISFDFYAVENMNPSDMATLSFTDDNPDHFSREYSAIPLYNPSGRFDEDVSGSEEVNITFYNSGTLSENDECAVIIDNLKIE